MFNGTVLRIIFRVEVGRRMVLEEVVGGGEGISELALVSAVTVFVGVGVRVDPPHKQKPQMEAAQVDPVTWR